jgi:hypothetical protein
MKNGWLMSAEFEEEKRLRWNREAGLGFRLIQKILYLIDYFKERLDNFIVVPASLSNDQYLGQGKNG